MNRNLKIFLGILGLVILGFLVLVAYFFYLKPEKIIPYPYEFTSLSFPNSSEAEKADFVIVGDDSASLLKNYIAPVSSKYAEVTNRTPIIFDWSAKNEPLHRSIAKLKSLSKLPKYIIYMGGGHEWAERKFSINDKKQIISNFKMYHDDEIISLIITFPWLSKFIFHKMTYFKLSADQNLRSPEASLNFDEMELSFLFYENELQELISLVKNKGSHLILITTPINHMIVPKLSCEDSVTNTIIGIQMEIEEMLQNGQFKDAFNRAIDLERESVSNARTQHLLALSALRNNQLKIAREAFMKANSFDCRPWRTKSVYNQIILNLAQKNSINIVDFENLTEHAILNNEEVFFDELIPQAPFYHKMVDELKDVIAKLITL